MPCAARFEAKEARGYAIVHQLLPDKGGAVHSCRALLEIRDLYEKRVRELLEEAFCAADIYNEPPARTYAGVCAAAARAGAIEHTSVTYITSIDKNKAVSFARLTGEASAVFYFVPQQYSVSSIARIPSPLPDIHGSGPEQL